MGADPSLLQRLRDQQVLLQLNAGSLAGAYSPAVKKMAQYMVTQGLVDFLGSDIHHQRHLDTYVQLRKSKDYVKLRKLPLLNDQLMA